MKHLFLINPAAGSRDRTAYYQAQIQQHCQGLDYTVAVSAAPGDCTRLARQAAQSGEEVRIYACGGDGTLNEVAAGAAGFPNAAVTVFSGGSGNDFVKIFSQPDAFFSLERLLDAETAQFDLIDCNGHTALNICSVGLDARIGADVASYKRLPLLHGFRAYVLSTLINVLRGIGAHYSVRIGEETIDGRFTMICACNGRFYGGGFCPVPEAQPDDGILDVLLVREVSRLQVPGVVGKYKQGRYRELPQLVQHHRTHQLTIHCDHPQVVNLDGEVISGQTVTISVSPKKLRFFYPRGLTFRAPD